MKPSRRFIVGGAAGISAAIIAGVFAPRWFAKRYPATPYDDLLGLLDDREAAKRIGRRFLKEYPNFTAPKAAHALRQRVGKRTLESVLESEIANGQLTEADHWVLPQTLVGLCALAAKT
jgi:hypothetical protein